MNVNQLMMCFFFESYMLINSLGENCVLAATSLNINRHLSAILAFLRAKGLNYRLIPKTKDYITPLGMRQTENISDIEVLQFLETSRLHNPQATTSHTRYIGCTPDNLHSIPHGG
jgi:hypothetical protein